MKEISSSFLDSDKVKEFVIIMDNEFIDMETGRLSQSHLKTTYKRIIYDRPVKNVSFVKYLLDESSYRKAELEKPMVWSFARGFEFYNGLYALKNEEHRRSLLDEGKSTRAFETVEESFARLPKLPSVFLLMMQVFDILAFDSFLSFVHSQEGIKEKLNEYVKIKELSRQNIDMSIGATFEESIFKQGDFYISYLGESPIYDIFEYYADASDVVFNNRSIGARKSKSLYSGKLLLSKEDGDLYRASMEELIVPIDGSQKVVKRRIDKIQI